MKASHRYPALVCQKVFVAKYGEHDDGGVKTVVKGPRCLRSWLLALFIASGNLERVMWDVEKVIVMLKEAGTIKQGRCCCH
jgi:hypothetical protein